jgi:hypothetical protein
MSAMTGTLPAQVAIPVRTVRAATPTIFGRRLVPRTTSPVALVMFSGLDMHW